MANSTFSGTVRSENGFESVTKTAGTGAIVVNSQFGSAATLTTEEGTGIAGATGGQYLSSVSEQGGIITTRIYIDIDGLVSSSNIGDIIGKVGAANCHLGQITAVQNGTIFGGTVTCLEVPAGGDPNILLYSAVEDTGTEDTLITDLDETALTAAGDWTLALTRALVLLPAADEYLYLATGAATDVEYTVGIFMIELLGYRA